ncbi:translation initiation factor IF-2 [Microcoleus sp. FACHB-831]|jgi:translation initiation factor IF-2|uniref:translation initiation factor IF-2 n=1 Tax=Microcoleus sp. FACHB-831 TaxID=2692827 RepID=UPI00168512D4|nr:translation initiation factor IF-2 [Microcoleus sp. FACHB-831]MBD1923614.1 translation initiation factor IF-2 [Microcoleus sp. FACHB-831]
MNNGKVRIYELSKELNLDNKDILGICDQLNIAVKSHSSTITESEAERIRSLAAEKQSERQAAAAKRVGTAGGADKKSGPSSGNSNQHKQQILQIKHKSGSGSGSNSKQPGAAKLASPPSPPSKQHTASPSPMKQTTLTRPVRSSNQDANPTSAPVEELEESQEIPEMEAFVEESPSQPEIAAKPLAEPPVRPVAESSAPAIFERPVLKRANAQAAPSSRAPSPSAGEPKVSQPETKPLETRPVVAKKPTPKPEPGVDTKVSESPQPVSDLQRPQKKVRAVGGVTPPVRDSQKPDVVKISPRPVRLQDDSRLDRSSVEIDENDKGTNEPELLELELKRPNPPRPAKTKKAWEEEEEDPDIANKNKAASKVKRRPAIVDEDDDDFASDLEDLPETVVVSLSVARPPKPKGRPGQPIAPAAIQAPGASRARKPGHKTAGDTSNSRDTRRGGQKNNVVERPEKVVLTGSMSLRELAEALAVPETEIIKKLFFKGMAVNITQTLDVETAKMVAEELDVEVEIAQEQSQAIQTVWVTEEDLESLQRRPPVVTIMGHVDHGKTSLLDAIRETKVAQGEAGGITQHIGAYHVDVEHEGKKEQIVFLDTPGHEAFTAMRARGAKVTDIAILVVAADDGVQPQTVEAISHAKAAEVPIVVAINKIDKADAQPDRVKQELTEYGLVAEEWGGDTIMVPVSALQKENLDTLLEMILLVAEVAELGANPDREAKGTVIEAHLDKAKGPVATLLVQNGTLRVGDTLVAGSVFGKVRAMVDDRGKRVEVAGPSWPVEVLGLSDVPAAGDEFEVYESEKEARSIASDRSDQQRQSRLQQVMASRRVTLNTLSQQAKEGELKELNLILKADVQGSLEALLGALKQLPQNEVQIRVLLSAPGEITETDVDLAAASGAVIVGFNTTLATGARQAADQAAVDVREYNIIYKLLDDIQGAMEGLLEPEMVEEPLGQVEVRAVFPVGKGAVAGCYVLSGKAIRNCRVRVRRGGKVLHEGVLDSLKRMKEDSKEVNAGFECGIGLDKFNAWEEGDIIETYQMVSKRRTLSPT